MDNYLLESLKKYKQAIKEVEDSIHPLKEEIERKLYFLDIFFFSEYKIEEHVNLEYIKKVTETLELSSTFDFKTSKSFITFSLPSSNIVSEDLDYNSYVEYSNVNNYFFRFYSNNTIDINDNAYLTRKEGKSKYNIKDCFDLMIRLTTMLKHLYYFNKYLEINNRIHWKFNKPTDSDIYDLADLKNQDYLNIIIESNNIVDFNSTFYNVAYLNSIRTLKFLDNINNQNRKQFIEEYLETIVDKRSKFFKIVYKNKFEQNAYIENKLNTFIGFNSVIMNIEIPFRTIIVSRKDTDKINYLITKFNDQDYLCVVSKTKATVFTHASTGIVVRDRELLYYLNQNIIKLQKSGVNKLK